jgi:hypothetical protein
MLTSDLLRVKVRKGEVCPRYLDTSLPEARERAEQLCALFEEHLEEPRGALEDAIEEVVGHGTDFLIWRGLAKLLQDRSEFDTVAAADPVEIRREVFARSAELGPVVDEEVRRQVLEEAAAALDITAEECEAGLYADLDARQRLVEHRGLTAQKLLDRYNVALAQAVLYRATSLEIVFTEPDPNRLRYLFQALKFFRLMHRTRRISDGSYRMVVDGPASLFKKSRKYGLQMATFLPALMLVEDWQLRAELDWKGDGTTHEMHLGADDGLVSHYRARGQWLADEEKMLEQRFEDLDCGWTLERRGVIHELEEDEVLVSDYVLRREEDGAEVYLEVVGFWRANYLERRLEMLRALEDVPLVLIVGERLQVDRRELEEAPPEVVFYKGVILSKKVVACAERIAGEPPTPEES